MSESTQQLESRIQELELELATARKALSEHQRQQDQERCDNERTAARLRHLLELLPAGVLLIDNHGRITLANAAAADLLGEPLVDQTWISVIQRSFAPKVDDGHEVSLKDGRRVSLATTALDSEPGQLVLLTNQTETRMLQQRLGHFQRLSEMGRMMASLAHQIRTPLSAAMLYVSHLTNAELADDARIKFATKIKSRLDHLEQQVRDMLVFARGETKLDEILDTEGMFLAIDDLLDLPLANFDADCQFDNQASGISIQCNREALLGAILNLVNNALQATGKGAEILIRAEVQQQRLLISVVDSGPGMDDETVSRALEPFYTTKSHGTGLGLAVAQVVARGHHGDFLLQSAPGAGTTATFSLPVMTTEAQA